MQDKIENVPPHSVEAEMNVIGSVFVAPAVIDDVALRIVASDFYLGPHQVLFAAMLEMRNEGIPLDVITLVERLKTAGSLEGLGGAAYIGKLINQQGTAANVLYYTDIVADKSTLRKLSNAGWSAVRAAHDKRPEVTPTEAVEQSEAEMFSILEHRMRGDVPTDISDLLHDALDEIEGRTAGAAPGVLTTFPDVDQLLGGFRPSEMIVLGGRPGHGKTSFALSAVLQIAREEHVLFCSLEMSNMELMDRILSMRSGVNLYRLRSGSMDQAERHRIVGAAGELARLHLSVDDNPHRSLSQLASIARREKRRQGSLGLVVIDYLQLVTPENSREPRQEQVAKMSRRCKILARELEAPILMLAQVNRSSGESERAPRLSELRESGAIEQDADVVMFVHRPAEYDNTLRPTNPSEFERCELIVAKHRNGPTGKAELGFFREYAEWVSASSRQEDEADDDPGPDPDDPNRPNRPRPSNPYNDLF